MPHKREKYVPKHRQDAAPRVAAQAPRKVLRNTVVLSSVAAAATAGVVTTGVAGTSVSVSAAAQDLNSVVSEPSADREPTEREAPLSRSDRREPADPAKQAALAQEDGPVVTRTESLEDEDPRSVARALMPQFGFSADQFGCLDSLWVSESDWRIDADNPTSSAYGIPQALTELHDLPADYMTSAESQIRWGLGYIQDSYGSPCSAWSFKQANNWY